ncbi:MAG TPA: NAD(P)-binding domain-containing protein [Mycobacterium sp.]|nr:NAD(P)-binding domain-containing protein [Mycobacterium sp.]HUH69921.1 NAD(P)-binding domain-containing protein [Mycobacterium sp.]
MSTPPDGASRSAAPLTVTIVGAGPVGAALGTNLLRHGHQVRYAVRQQNTTVPAGATTVPVDGSANGWDLTILTVPFAAVGEVVPTLGLQAGDVLIDATNPFEAQVPDGHLSGAEYVQQLAGDGVHVVKTFNVLGVEHMVDPALPGGDAPVLPVVTDDDEVRSRVVDLAREMGFDAVPAGGLPNAATTEAAALYWGLLAMTAGLGRDMALVARRRAGDDEDPRP